MTALWSKPCACGRDGCIAYRRERETRGEFSHRKYASRSCARRHRNMVDPAMFEARAKGARAQRGQPKPHRPPAALVTNPAWLERPCGRIQAQRQAHGVELP